MLLGHGTTGVLLLAVAVLLYRSPPVEVREVERIITITVPAEEEVRGFGHINQVQRDLEESKIWKLGFPRRTNEAGRPLDKWTFGPTSQDAACRVTVFSDDDGWVRAVRFRLWGDKAGEYPKLQTPRKTGLSYREENDLLIHATILATGIDCDAALRKMVWSRSQERDDTATLFLDTQHCKAWEGTHKDPTGAIASFVIYGSGPEASPDVGLINVTIKDGDW